MDPIYVSSILTNTVSITPRELNQNINQVILNKLRVKVEGKCLEEGYIKPGSVEIVSRTAGTLNQAHFNGNIRYKIRYKADVCHPIQNQLIKCIINTVGKPGIQAYIEDKDKSPLYIMLAKGHHLNNKYFGTLKEGDHIRVRVINSEFNFCEDKIRVLAVLDTTKNTEMFNLTENESKSRSSMSSNKLKNKIGISMADSDEESDFESDDEELLKKKSDSDDEEEKSDSEDDEEDDKKEKSDSEDEEDDKKEKSDSEDEEDDKKEKSDSEDDEEESEDDEEESDDDEEESDSEEEDEKPKQTKKKITLKKKN